MTTQSEENPALQSFKAFIKSQAAKRNLSMRKLSIAIGMTPSYFSEILSGKKRINVEFLNSLADYLQIPRVEVYQEAGWLDLNEEDLMMNRVKKWVTEDPYFRQALEIWANMEAEQRHKVFSWVLYKTLQETNRLQTYPMPEAEKEVQGGELHSEVLDQLNPEQRQALSGVVQMMLEAFLAKDARGESKKFLEDIYKPRSK